MGQPSLNPVASCYNPNGWQPPRGRRETQGCDPFFKSAQWSADGTTLFTSSSSNRICTFVLPENLLEPRQGPITLDVHGTLVLPEPTSAIAPCPYFALEHPSTQVLLTASTDHPIHLHHAFPPRPASASSSLSSPPSPFATTTPDEDDNDGQEDAPTEHQPKLLASFHLIKQETEAYLPVTSLIWPRPGTHFIAGTANLLAVYDVSRPASTPLLSVPTIPSTRHLAKGGGVGMRGTVAALAAASQPDGLGWGVVAAGTWTRNLGLYDLARAGSGACIATWSVAPAAKEAGVGGRGVVQTVWSPCGRYLLINERGANGLLVYDVRGRHRLLACLEGRSGETNQRLSCDVFRGSEETGGFEVWAGTKDGGVVLWEGVGNCDGGVAPSWEWKVHGSAVGSTAMHMSGSVVATCSGSWKIADEDYYSSDISGSSDSSDESDSDEASGLRSKPKPRIVVQETSLKVWSIGPSDSPQVERRAPDEQESEP